MKKIFALILSLCLSAPLYAIDYPLTSANQRVVGQLSIFTTEALQTITDIAQNRDIGYNRFQAANPWYSFNNLRGGMDLVVPSRYILPDAPQVGIVVNVAELMMYYYPKGKNLVEIYPIGIGKEGDWQTPIMKTHITYKEANPYWYPPKSVQEDFLKTQGYPLPKVFAPGGINPLGAYAIHLGVPGYLIHGSNDPGGIGQRVTAGCMRMYPDDIARLFQEVNPGIKVEVVYQPVLVAMEGGLLYLEVIPPLPDTNYPKMPNYLPLVEAAVHAYERQHPKETIFVNWEYAKSVDQLRLGLPEVIGWVHHDPH